MEALVGFCELQLVRAREALERERGQGTVEYVGLILLVGLVMFGVVAALKGYKNASGKELGDLIVNKIKDAIEQVKY